MFARGKTPVEVAQALEVSTKSAYTWRRAWADGGTEALVSKGSPGSSSRLSPQQLVQLESMLIAGPAASGFAEDQRWTLARVATVIANRFHIRYSLKGVSLVLRRLGWTPQMPKHRAVERNEDAITRWRRYQWPAVKGSRAGWARGSASLTRQPKR
jgi:putative transposase